MGQVNLKKSDIYNIVLELLREFFIIQMGDNWKNEVTAKAREKMRGNFRNTYAPISNGEIDITGLYALMHFDFTERCALEVPNTQKTDCEIFLEFIESFRAFRNDYGHTFKTDSFSENKLIYNGISAVYNFLDYLEEYWDYTAKDEFITKYRNAIEGNINFIKTIDNDRLKELVDKEIAEAQLEMFIRIKNGKIDESGYNKYDLLKSASDTGIPEANARLALHKLFKEDVSEKEIVEASELIEAAGDNSPFAKYVRGRKLELGINIKEPDLENAYKWYGESANLGCEEAAIRKAYLLARGSVKDKDGLNKEDGLAKLKSIAKNNKSPYAYELLGMCYEETNQYQKSFETFNEGVKETNDALLKFRLAECFYRRTPITDDEKAFKLFTEAFENGVFKAQFKLGLCYYYGRGTVKNEEKAFELFTKAAEAGDLDAKYYLGQCYFYGHGTEKITRMAYENFAKSATKIPQAMLMLGLCLLNEKKEKEAFKCFNNAAERGSNAAQYYLGKCYYFAYGTNKNLEEAINCFNKSAANNDIESEFMLGVCYQEKNQNEEAIRYYKKAAEEGHKKAKNFLEYFELSKKGINDNNIERFKLLFSAGVTMAKEDIINFLYSKHQYEELETICLENKWFSELTVKYFNDVIAWTSITKLQTYSRTIQWLNKAKQHGYNNADAKITEANNKFKNIKAMHDHFQ